MALTNLTLTLLLIYIIVVLGIGLWSSRRQKSEDYLIAGRKLGTWSFIATIIASYIGGGALVAFTAYVYEFGISAISIYVGIAIGFLIFTWYALRIRRLGKQHNFYTLSDWVYHKYDRKTGLLSAIIILIVYLGILANQFIAGTSILSGISGWSYELSLIISGLIVLVYLALGGFKSVVRTDIFQYAIFLVLFIVLGFAAIGNQAVVPELLDPTGIGYFLIFAFMLYGIFTILVGPEYWQRIYAAKNDKVIKHGLIGSAILIILTGAALSLIGLAAGSISPGLDPNQAFVYGLTNLVPVGLFGLGVILVFAAIMSSADTLIFVLSASITKDYFGRLFNKKMTEDQMKKMTRSFIIIVSILGVLLAFFFRDIVSVILTVGGMILALGPPVLAPFHWKIKRKAAFASLLSGPIYVGLIIATGNLIPEYAAASIVVSGVVLILGQIFFKKETRNFINP